MNYSFKPARSSGRTYGDRKVIFWGFSSSGRTCHSRQCTVRSAGLTLPDGRLLVHGHPPSRSWMSPCPFYQHNNPNIYIISPQTLSLKQSYVLESYYWSKESEIQTKRSRVELDH